MVKAIRYTEKDLNTLLDNNPKLTINEENTNKISINKDTNANTKISLSNGTSNTKVKTKTSQLINIYQLNKGNKSAKISTSSSENHISIALEGAKLLTINQIFAFLQRDKLRESFFTYKKSWHGIMYEILQQMYFELKADNKELPFFDESVEVTIFRQAPRLVDEDAVSTMFKFIIDGLKKTESNPYGILAEDNPKIVHRINSYSEKGPHAVGIKVKRLLGIKRETYNIEKLLSE